MVYTVTPYVDTQKDAFNDGFLQPGALFFHPDKDRDLVMQAIKIMQPVSRIKLLFRLYNHKLNAAKVDTIIQDLLTDNLIKEEGYIESGKRKKKKPAYSIVEGK